jgi:hypothetical protein
MLFGDKTAAESDPRYLGELDRQLAGRGWDQSPDAGTLANIRKWVIYRYQETGNPVQAVLETLNEVKRRWDAKQRASSDPPLPGARKAPDGFWYVKHGNGFARVDVRG